MNAPTSRPGQPAPSSRAAAARVLSAMEIPALVAVPVALALCAYFKVEQGALLTVAVALAAVGVFFASFETSRPALRHIMPTVVLAALAAAGRVLFAPVPQFKPVSALCILAGAVFGPRSGFLVGALAALVSNFFFGQGPWTPWQMYAWGMVGYLAGVFARRGWLDKPVVLYAFGFVSALFYGALLNGWYLIGFVHPLTVPAAVVALGASLPLDVLHGVATVVFLAALYAPWRKKLERIKRNYALVDPDEFASGAPGKAGRMPSLPREGLSMSTQRASMSEAVAALARGEAVIFPTETVYGLGVSVQAATGPDVLYQLKERDRGKPISWLVEGCEDLERYGVFVPDYARRLARTYWPGPLTLIVKASENVPSAFRSAEGSIGLRMPDNATALELIRAAGCPLATTSANRSGDAAVGACEALDPQLVRRVGVLVADEADDDKSGLASTVVDCTAESPRILREGAIMQEDVAALA